MSLLTAVLEEANKADIEALKKLRIETIPKLKDLTERVKLLSWALQQNFIDNYFNFTPTKSLEQLNYKNRKNNILADYSKLLEYIKVINEKLPTKDEEFNNVFKKLDSAVKVLNNFCIVVEGKQILNKANHEFGSYNYIESMTTVKNLLHQLYILKFEGNAAKALSNLSDQAENQLALYTSHLSVEWEDIFTWTEKKSVYHLTYGLSVQQSDPMLKQKVLESLYVTERLNAELGLFSHFFIDELLHNVIRHNCDIFTEDDIGALVFNIKIDLNDPKKPNFQTIFNNLMAIFEFLQSTLGFQFENDKSFIQVFADSIRQKFFNKVIEDCIRSNLPSCDSSYEDYKNIVIELESFNKFLIDLKFVEANESPLNKYVNDTECILYNKKCDKLLSDVRNLLGESLSHGTVVVGSATEVDNESILDATQIPNNHEYQWNLSNPLFLPKSIISENVRKIMQMIVEHLEEGTKLPEKYNKQLVMYIRDIAIMYQCIVPKKFKSNLEHCPLDIALFFNNCYYLAHSLVGPPWQKTLPSPLADLLTTILIECVQDLRVVGLEKMSLYLETQKNIIVKKIGETELPWTQDSYETFDGAVNGAITVMKDLRASWYNVLPLRMFDLSICTLAQALCQAMLDRLFANSKPISEELVYMLAVRFEDTITEIISLFEEPLKLETKINVWPKFIKMPQLLKAQLLETADLWRSDKLLAQSYTCEEIRQIVKFKFPDNKYRLKILKEIQ